MRGTALPTDSRFRFVASDRTGPSVDNALRASWRPSKGVPVQYAPVPEPRAKKDELGNEVKQDKHRPKPDDSAAVAQWRARMASEEANEIYKRRAATAECVNAQARNWGLLRMPVRGLAQVRSVVGLLVLAHNLLRMSAIAPQLIGRGTAPSAMAAQAA
jgi:hypothetical protein